jgi:hypothetical protein
MKLLRLVLWPLLLGLTGCQTTQYTDFAPLDARLEPVPGGGAKYFLLINTSGKTLHNVSFSAYLWDETSPNVLTGRQPFLHGSVSHPEWPPGRAQRFRPRDMGIEGPITRPVTKVEVVGHCDEGYFRQLWLGTSSDQLQPSGAHPRSAQELGQTAQYTIFAPVNAWLEPSGKGSARYLVLVNASGRDMDNYKLAFYLWVRRLDAQTPLGGAECSGTNWIKGEELRARDQATGLQIPVNEEVAKLEVIGHCDEGSFFQGWLGNQSGHLEPLEPKPGSAAQ